MSDERSAGGTKYVKGHHEETVLHRRANLGFGSTSFLLALGLPTCFLPLNNPHLQNSQLQCHVIHDKPTRISSNLLTKNSWVDASPDSSMRNESKPPVLLASVRDIHPNVTLYMYRECV
jgi:hypothetical protein